MEREMTSNCTENTGELMKMVGFDDCIAGILFRMGQDDIVVYDLQKVLNKLQSQGMSEEEAREYVDFNIAGAWMGPTNPGFLDTDYEPYFA